MERTFPKVGEVRLDGVGGVSASSGFNLLDRDEAHSKDLNHRQSQVDRLVSEFVHAATEWKSLVALTAGGLAYRVGRIGLVSSHVGAHGRIPLQGLSIAAGLSAEVSAFELTHRGLQSKNSNLWKWSGPEGLGQGLFRSLMTFSTLKGFGRLTQNQNLILQHGAQDVGMVLGLQLAYRTGIGLKPEGQLSEQLLHAEATTLQLKAGLALGHSLVGRHLDGIGRSPKQIQIPPLRAWHEPLLSFPGSAFSRTVSLDSRPEEPAGLGLWFAQPPKERRALEEALLKLGLEKSKSKNILKLFEGLQVKESKKVLARLDWIRNAWVKQELDPKRLEKIFQEFFKEEENLLWNLEGLESALKGLSIFDINKNQKNEFLISAPLYDHRWDVEIFKEAKRGGWNFEDVHLLFKTWSEAQPDFIYEPEFPHQNLPRVMKLLRKFGWSKEKSLHLFLQLGSAVGGSPSADLGWTMGAMMPALKALKDIGLDQDRQIEFLVKHSIDHHRTDWFFHGLPLFVKALTNLSQGNPSRDLIVDVLEDIWKWNVPPLDEFAEGVMKNEHRKVSQYISGFRGWTLEEFKKIAAALGRINQEDHQYQREMIIYSNLTWLSQFAQLGADNKDISLLGLIMRIETGVEGLRKEIKKPWEAHHVEKRTILIMNWEYALDTALSSLTESDRETFKPLFEGDPDLQHRYPKTYSILVKEKN